MSATPKQRADLLLVARGLAADQRKAQALIMAGAAYAGTRRIAKSAELLPNDTQLTLKTKSHDFVSRGALKLQAALDHFGIDPTGLVCLDIGASTGGFTDLLRRRGAKQVYAVDVGTNQLDWRLRQDEHVIVLEQCDARGLTPVLIPEAPALITADVSFASLTRVMPAPLNLAAAGATAVLLIKPQFELPRDQVPRGGVVRDAAAQAAVCAAVERWFTQEMGWESLGIIPSPITGQDGNQEYLLAGRKHGANN